MVEAKLQLHKYCLRNVKGTGSLLHVSSTQERLKNATTSGRKMPLGTETQSASSKEHSAIFFSFKLFTSLI